MYVMYVVYVKYVVYVAYVTYVMYVMGRVRSCGSSSNVARTCGELSAPDPIRLARVASSSYVNLIIWRTSLDLD